VAGKLTIRLVRKLIRLRRQNPEFRGGEHFFYNHLERYQDRGLLLYSRFTRDRFSLVALNFTDTEQVVPFWFPMSGTYSELLDGDPADYLPAIAANTEVQLRIPSNYGRIWSRIE
jgi:hypothetical protein